MINTSSSSSSWPWSGLLDPYFFTAIDRIAFFGSSEAIFMAKCRRLLG
jgi:hypothetical protein